MPGLILINFLPGLRVESQVTSTPLPPFPSQGQDSDDFNVVFFFGRSRTLERRSRRRPLQVKCLLGQSWVPYKYTQLSTPPPSQITHPPRSVYSVDTRTFFFFPTHLMLNKNSPYPLFSLKSF